MDKHQSPEYPSIYKERYMVNREDGPLSHGHVGPTLSIVTATRNGIMTPFRGTGMRRAPCVRN
jgi:hypothetical protein